MSSIRPRPNPVLRRLAIFAAALGIAVIVQAVASCGPNDQHHYDQRLARTGAPALHAVHSDRLRQIMSKLVYSLTLDPPDRMTEPQRHARQVAEVARAMAANARTLPDAVGEAAMSGRDRQVFLRLADKLGSEADAVSVAADRLDYEAARRAIERMQTTCNACHSLFRADPG